MSEDINSLFWNKEVFKGAKIRSKEKRRVLTPWILRYRFGYMIP